MFSEIFDTNLASHLRAPEASLLLGMWQSARGIRKAPDIADFPERGIGYLKPALMILHPTGKDDWIYTYYGAQVAQQAGFDMTGKCVSEFNGKLAEFFLSLYNRASQACIPLVSLHRLGAYGETPLWERVILPMRTSDGVLCLYVINKVREIERDISHLTARAKGRALAIIQFRRDEQDEITEPVIVGANGLARAILGRRPDQLSGNRLATAIPDLAHPYLQEIYAEVARTGIIACMSLEITCHDGPRRFDCQISPFNDGVTVDFQPEQVSPILTPEPLPAA